MNKIFSLLLISVAVSVAVGEGYGNVASSVVQSSVVQSSAQSSMPVQTPVQVPSSNSGRINLKKLITEQVTKTELTSTLDFHREKLTEIDGFLAKIVNVEIQDINATTFDASAFLHQTCADQTGFFTEFYGFFAKFVANVLNSNMDWLSGVMHLKESVLEIYNNQQLIISSLRDFWAIFQEIKIKEEKTVIPGEAKIITNEETQQQASGASAAASADNQTDSLKAELAELRSMINDLKVQVKSQGDKLSACNCSGARTITSSGSFPVPAPVPAPIPAPVPAPKTQY